MHQLLYTADPLYTCTTEHHTRALHEFLHIPQGSGLFGSAWSLLYYVMLSVIILPAIFHQSIFGGLITYVVGMCCPHRGLHLALNQAAPHMHTKPPVHSSPPVTHAKVQSH